MQAILLQTTKTDQMINQIQSPKCTNRRQQDSAIIRTGLKLYSSMYRLTGPDEGKGNTTPGF